MVLRAEGALSRAIFSSYKVRGVSVTSLCIRKNSIMVWHNMVIVIHIVSVLVLGVGRTHYLAPTQLGECPRRLPH